MDFQVYYKIPFWLVENRWGKVFKDGCHPIAKKWSQFQYGGCVLGCISLIYLLFFCPSLTDFLVKKIWSLIRYYFVSMASDSPFHVVQSISILSCYCFNLSTFFFFCDKRLLYLISSTCFYLLEPENLRIMIISNHLGSSIQARICIPGI